jgi:hypothetical protein
VTADTGEAAVGVSDDSLTVTAEGFHLSVHLCIEYQHVDEKLEDS